MVDKEFCMSSYLAFRYIEKPDVDFYENTKHSNYVPVKESDRILVKDAADIDKSIEKQINSLKSNKLGLLLSGGMDSAIIASYLKGCDAYTFRFLDSDHEQSIFNDEIKRAEYYADFYNLKLHYVDINWDIVDDYLDDLMIAKGAPVHSIEPQIYKAALQAKSDGIDLMLVGESSDLIFGGMDKLLSKDWSFDEFVERYTFTNPFDVLNNPKDVNYLFEKYRDGESIKLLEFMDNVFSIESSSSYMNAFSLANLTYFDPYAKLKMKEKLDLDRVRSGEPKYLIRDLMTIKYPEIPVPDKIPMPRTVDEWFRNWDGPKRNEFISNLDMSCFNGNQKWQIYCLERFLNLYE